VTATLVPVLRTVAVGGVRIGVSALAIYDGEWRLNGGMLGTKHDGARSLHVRMRDQHGRTYRVGVHR
jgi:hypothetical protein